VYSQSPQDGVDVSNMFRKSGGNYCTTETVAVLVACTSMFMPLPLYVAWTQVMKFLIERGADPNFKDKFGGSALLDAMRCGHEEITAYLKKQGAG